MDCKQQTLKVASDRDGGGVQHPGFRPQPCRLSKFGHKAGCYTGAELSPAGRGGGDFPPLQLWGEDADKISRGGGVGGWQRRKMKDSFRCWNGVFTGNPEY